MTYEVETRAINRQIQSKLTLTPPPPPPLSHDPSLLHLPSHLIEHILFRLPVKSLIQLQCLCKELNSLISDPKFRKNHLRFCFSTNRFNLHTISPLMSSIYSYPINSIFATMALFNRYSTTDLESSPFNGRSLTPDIVGSCDGILCLAENDTDLIVMCNPSIRKFNQLPLSTEEEENQREENNKAYGFGYDPLSHHYKVVVVKGKSQISETKIHTLGTNIWRRIGDFPFSFLDRIGVSLNGTVNWLAYNDKERTSPDSSCVIVSLDLGHESFHRVPQPNYGRANPPHLWNLSVQRDCLCLLADQDVWMMKEFGNQNSWTKLITIPYLKDPSISYGFNKLFYISEDDKFVLDAYGYGIEGRLVIYESKNGFIEHHHTLWTPLELSIESLILLNDKPANISTC